MKMYLRSWCGLVACLSTLGCSFRAEKSVSSARLLVHFETGRGEAIPGGIIRWGKSRLVTRGGTAELRLPYSERGQHVIVECPLLHLGSSEQRQLTASTLSAGGVLEWTMICEPLARSWVLSVHSACKSAEIFLDGHALGSAQGGWFHAQLTEVGSDDWSVERHMSLKVRSADPGCRFIDPWTRRATREVEVPAVFSATSRALWVDFPRVPVAGRRVQQSPAVRRPYRL